MPNGFEAIEAGLRGIGDARRATPSGPGEALQTASVTRVARMSPIIQEDTMLDTVDPEPTISQSAPEQDINMQDVSTSGANTIDQENLVTKRHNRRIIRPARLQDTLYAKVWSCLSSDIHRCIIQLCCCLLA